MGRSGRSTNKSPGGAPGNPGVIDTFLEAFTVALGNAPPPARRLRARPPALEIGSTLANALIREPKLRLEERAETGPAPGGLMRPRGPDDSWRSRTLRHPARILLVEDDPELLALLAALFRGFECRVFEVRDGQAALSVAYHHHPELVITDFHLPGLNGFELIREMRQHEPLQRTPVILLTAHPRAESFSDSLRLETVAYLKKPVGKDQILDAAQQALGGRFQAKEKPEGLPCAIPAGASEKDALSGDELEIPETVRPGSRDSGGPPTLPRLRECPAETASPARASQSPCVPEKAPPPQITIQTLLEQGAAAGNLHELAAPNISDLHCVAADDPPVIRFVNSVISQAVERKASDIHIEPQETSLRIRFRIDGELVSCIEAPLPAIPAISARIKIMANLDIAERRIPQDGRFRLQLDRAGRVELRVNTLPCKYGEKIVLRILGRARIEGDLSALRLSKHDEDTLGAVLASPNGLILATGPTGSGKTTTLYTMIATLNTPNRNVLTVEEPVEYELPGISQVAVNPDLGLTFDRALRAFLRQDPDIILVGEIRDSETADIAVKAAVTGHLVLSSLHTNDAVTSISRLMNMGVPPYMISAALKLVVAQRLVRLLCPCCKTPARLSDEELRILTRDEALRLEEACRAAGCPACGHTGYSGRTAVMEILRIKSPSMRELIARGAPPDVLRAQALQEGTRTLRESALQAVERGETSLAEAVRILLADQGL